MIGNYEGKIKEYVNDLFENTPKTRKSEEFKEELLANLLDKYYDLLESNMDDENAYNKVISNIGSIDELFDKDPVQITKESWDKKKNAKITAIAVMMYILCPVSVIVFGEVGFETLGIVVMFLLIAGATGLLIYNNMTKPQYLKQDDTLVEDFKEWKSTTNKSRRVRKSIENVLPPHPFMPIANTTANKIATIDQAIILNLIQFLSFINLSPYIQNKLLLLFL